MQKLWDFPLLFPYYIVKTPFQFITMKIHEIEPWIVTFLKCWNWIYFSNIFIFILNIVLVHGQQQNDNEKMIDRCLCQYIRRRRRNDSELTMKRFNKLLSLCFFFSHFLSRVQISNKTCINSVLNERWRWWWWCLHNAGSYLHV